MLQMIEDTWSIASGQRMHTGSAICSPTTWIGRRDEPQAKQGGELS